MNQRTEKILEYYIENKETIFGIAIVAGVIISIVCLLLISSEVYGAWKFCDSVEGIYRMDYFTLTHTCNESPIYNYNPGGWSYPIPTFPIN